MAFIEPPPMRSRMEDGPEGLGFVMRSRKHSAIFITALWVGLWIWDVPDDFRDLVSTRVTVIDIVWAIGWALLVLSGCIAVLWGLFGRERLIANAGILTHRYELFGLAWGREYRGPEMKDLRVCPVATGPDLTGLRSWGVGAGSVAFDYGSRTVRVAAVDEAEAAVIVERLAARLRVSSIAHDPAPRTPAPEPVPDDEDEFWNQD